MYNESYSSSDLELSISVGIQINLFYQQNPFYVKGNKKKTKTKQNKFQQTS